MIPKAEQLRLPPEYGAPNQKLSWETVSSKLRDARVYWLSTTRPDGRPHVVPRDGLWLDDKLFYGGSTKTVHHHNIELNPAVVAHVGQGQEAIIVEGAVSGEVPGPDLARELAEATYSKYPEYGRVEPSSYEGGIWILKPTKVIAWTTLYVDATRFLFSERDGSG